MRLRTLLSLVLAILLIVTSGFIGWLGYWSSRKAIEKITGQKFALATGIAGHEVSDFLNDPANRLLDEYSVRARRGMLNLKDDKGLGFTLAERLRVNPTLAWISYSDIKTGHFVGVWRAANGAVVLNISNPGQGEALEETVTTEGQEIPYQRPRVKEYDPREQPWFKNAVAATGTVWSEPYAFADGTPGITASRAWRAPDTGMTLGVFTVDFYLKDLEKLLNSVADKTDGYEVLLEPDGKLISASTNSEVTVLAALSQWVRDHPQTAPTNTLFAGRLVPIRFGTTSYLVALDHLETPSGLNCIVVGLVRKAVIFGKIDRAATQMELIGLAGLVLAVVAGSFLAFRISEPLHALCNDLAKVGQFYLAQEAMTRSIVNEVNELREASDRMKSGLRSFIKYVPDDLVRQLLASGQEAVLGGEMRRLTIFFSDIEGFSAHSQLVAPNILVRELAGYFEILSRRIRQHSGTIDKFIGDGLLGFFNAPEKVPHHENLACRATLIGLQELALRQKDGEMVPFRTRVGLHCGEVLVGNIGTPERFAYTVLGDVVNVASRLENLNKVYGTQILASGDLWAYAGADFEWKHIDRVTVFGRKGSMDIYELMGLTEGMGEDHVHSRKLYEEALELYFARSFRDARRIFGQVAERSPHDKSALLMMIRCEHLLTQDLPAEWDGVFVYNFK
jgi:adenylate cyclase